MNRPLADKVRPMSFDDMVGQEQLVGKNGVLRRMVDSGHITNMIFFGPPGTGKTTAANIVAEKSGMTLRRLNATTASLSDVKEVIEETGTLMGSGGILLYLDEIQYFNKKQQQSLLEYIEDGRITLIASTTENPYYYVYNAIISRSAVFEFRPVTPDEIKRALTRTLARLNSEEGASVTCAKDAMDALAGCGAGDVRRSIGLLENCFYLAETAGGEITVELIKSITPKVVGSFDRAGDVHYDLLSCLQKSIRGSDPDA
ncbi:MAG: AAA family ATPase, partial [Clostridia bacterium]|nr:AAA family ATPase [Clostridia bacterium]